MKEKIMKILEENCESLSFKKRLRNDEDEQGSNWNNEHFFQTDLEQTAELIIKELDALKGMRSIRVFGPVEYQEVLCREEDVSILELNSDMAMTLNHVEDTLKDAIKDIDNYMASEVENKKLIYEDDSVKVFNCGCRISKLESPTGKDCICKAHDRIK
jgi:hypothetical protein